MIKPNTMIVPLIAGLIFCNVFTAHADEIDGDWCSPDDTKRLSISGPKVITPSGNQITGNYGRHTFSYIAPEGDLQAGSTVFMRQLSEEQVQVAVDDGKSELWHRCRLSV